MAHKHAKGVRPSAASPSQARRLPARGQGLLAKRLVCALLVIAAGVLAFWPSLTGVFVWDDISSIVDNPHIHSLSPITSTLSAPHDTTLAGRPVASFTFAVNYALAPADARDVMTLPDGPPDRVAGFYRNVWGYHVSNLVIHLAAALVLFGVVRRTLVAPRVPVQFQASSLPLAFVVALLWVIHPLQTASVTYLVQRVESLMGLFYLLTLYCAIRALEPGGRAAWIPAAVVTCALGMGTKESMVTAPILVWIWTRLFGVPVGGRRWFLHTGLASTWVLLAYLVSFNVRPSTVGVGRGGWTSWGYLQTQFAVLVHYLGLAVVPTPLVLDYRWPPAPSFVSVLPQAVFVVGLAAIVGIRLYHRRSEAFMGAWFFVILAPTSSVLPIATEVAAEHRMYLPLAGVIAALVIGAYAVQRKWAAGWPRALSTVNGFVVLVVAILLVTATRARCEQYQSEEVLLADTVAKRPDNANARIALGGLLITKQRFGEAESQMRAILALDADTQLKANAHMLLGSALCAQSHLIEGIPHLRRALALDPTLRDAHALLGEAYVDSAQPALAAQQFDSAVRLSPDNPAILRRVAWFLATSPVDEIRDGPRAGQLAERARMLTGGRDPMVLEALAAAYAEQDRFSDAAETLRQAVALVEGSGDLRYADALRSELRTVEGGQKIRLPPGRY